MQFPVPSAGVVAVLLAACAAPRPAPIDPLDDSAAGEVHLAPSQVTSSSPRPAAVVFGPSRARPLEPDVAAEYRARLAALPAPTTPEDLGRIDAIRTILDGRLRLEILGAPSPCSANYTAVLERVYDVTLTRVAGCVVDGDIAGHARGFNEIMEAELERRHGPDVLTLAGAQAHCF